MLSRVELCNPVDCSPPGPSVHGILQARILEWVAVSSPEDIPNSEIKSMSPVLAGRFLTTEPPGEAHDSNLMRSKIHEYFWASLVLVVKNSPADAGDEGPRKMILKNYRFNNVSHCGERS